MKSTLKVFVANIQIIKKKLSGKTSNQ